MTAPRVTHPLAAVVGADRLIDDVRPYLTDETESRRLRGHADAVVAPQSTDEVAAVLAWCYEHGIPLVPRGGGTGYAGGAVPLGGVVLSLERLDRVRRLDPLLWRMEVEAGVTTHRVQRLARGHGLLFPPDPGAGEQSQIGGNIATNAGGPHAFKYGTTGAWVTGLEAVVPPGEVVRVGGPFRKDVAGYDLRHLLIGSEGTLGIITCAWLRLVPAPEAAHPLVALYPSLDAGCAAVESIVGQGLDVAALEFLDGGTLEAAPPTFLRLDRPAALALLVEVDGSAREAEERRRAAEEALRDGATLVHAASGAGEAAAVWRWREGVSLAVTARRGGKVSEDIVVPLDRLREAIEGTHEIATRHGLPAVAWGHAGDGNLHSTFLVDVDIAEELAAAERAADDLFALAASLGGSVSGEHGVGLAKNRQLRRVWAPRALELHAGVKALFDPKNLLNPGKKLAR
ncbi:MAG: FAD-binding oxidoreductase [Pseudomonadota bacterium]